MACRIMNTFPIINSPIDGRQLFKFLKSNPENKLFWEYGDRSIIDCMIGEHIWSERMKFLNFFRRIRERFDRLKIKRESYGDIDQTIILIHSTEDKSVFHFKDNCTCSDTNQWIIIHEWNECQEELHIREIHSRGDYPRSAYPKKLNLKFWKDRNYVCDYVEKHHMTNLGGVYGDIRDVGYTVSYKVWLSSKDKNSPNSKIYDRLSEMDSESDQRCYYYNEFKRFLFYIPVISRELDEVEKE